METTVVKAIGIDAVWYLSKDLAKSAAFYEELLDLKPASRADVWIEYELPDGSAFGLAQDPSGFWIRCGGAMFAVPEFEAAVERAKSLGTTIHQHMDTPVCHTAWCEDPDGNSFALHRRKT